MPPMPAPEPYVDEAAEEEKQARIDAVERRRSGRAGTIKTSDRGLLRLADDAPKKKTLLGE